MADINMEDSREAPADPSAWRASVPLYNLVSSNVVTEFFFCEDKNLRALLTNGFILTSRENLKSGVNLTALFQGGLAFLAALKPTRTFRNAAQVYFRANSLLQFIFVQRVVPGYNSFTLPPTFEPSSNCLTPSELRPWGVPRRL